MITMATALLMSLAATVMLSMAQTARQYVGAPVSLDFAGADLRAVLRVLIAQGGLNVVFDNAVQGTIDIVLHDIPWDQALDAILRANKLGYVAEGTIVRIAPLACSRRRKRSAGNWRMHGRWRRRSCAAIRAQLCACPGAAAAAHEIRAVLAGPDPGRHPHEHDHHYRSSRAIADRNGSDRSSGPARAASGGRGPHRPDVPRLRQSHRRSSGV